MIDNKFIDDIICHSKGCDDVKIAACKAGSGAVKELVYCQIDRCLYVTVDGRERLRCDVPSTAYRYFASTSPD